MPIQRVGHVVIKMRDLEAAKRFYGGVLGMKVADEREGYAVFFRFNDYHHDIAVFQVDADAAAPERNQVGLAHIALIIGSEAELREMHARFKAQGVEIVRTADHGVTRSVYVKDPEGNEIEVYCEVTETPWQQVDTIIKSEPFDLESQPA